MNEPAHGSGRRPLKGFLFALAGSALLASNYIVAKYALGGFRPIAFAFAWVAVSASLMFLVLAVQGKLRQIAVPRRCVKYVVLVGLFGCVNQLTFWAGLTQLDPSFASFLGRFWLLFTILGGIIVLGERLRPVEILAGAVMIAGGCISSFGEWGVVGEGTALIVIACVAFAGVSVTMKVAVPHTDPLVLNFYRLAIASLGLGGYVLFSGGHRFDAGPEHWGALLLGAVLAPCIGVLCVIHSYKYWELSRSTLVFTLQPLIVLPAACLLLRQYPSAQQLLGGSVILAGGLWLVLVHGWRRGEKTEPLSPTGVD